MKCLILHSGGLDSSTAIALYINKGYSVTTVTFNYNQKNHFEIKSSKKISSFYNVEHHIIKIDFGFIRSITSLIGEMDVPKFNKYNPKKDIIPNTYVPGRNMLFLAHSISMAERLKINEIVFSPNKDDHNDYPDCRIEFIKAFEIASNLGTKTGTQNQSNFIIHTPFIDKSKSDIIKLGNELGVPYSMTQTCYSPSSGGSPCRKCDACLLREIGFKKNNILDPLISDIF